MGTDGTTFARTVAAAAAIVLCGGLLLGCSSKDEGGASEPATTEASAADADAQEAAMDEAEQELATIRIPEAIGVFSETIQACVRTQYPQATRTDRSSLAPDDLATQLSEQLVADGWTQNNDANGRQSYSKDPFQLWVEFSVADDGDTKATLELATTQINCT